MILLVKITIEWINNSDPKSSSNKTKGFSQVWMRFTSKEN